MIGSVLLRSKIETDLESASKGDNSDLESELAHMILATIAGKGDQ